MDAKSRGRRWALRLGALTVLMLLPDLASAQPNALFPDIYIKRQRPCPGLEDPRYQHIRENYYGYFPTCWRRFPPGWGCPSADAPNWAAELQRLPLDVPQDLVGGGEGEGDGNAAPAPRVNDPFLRNQPREDLKMPELPPDRDPLFPRDGLNPTDPTAPVSPPPGNNPGTDPGLTPGGNGPTALVPDLTPTDSDPVAPPIAPPSAATPLTPPDIPTTSINDGVVPTTVKPTTRRGPVAQFFSRMRRK